MERRRLAPALGRRHSPLSKGISRVYGNSSHCTSAIGLGRFDEISAAVVPRTASCMRSPAPAVDEVSAVAGAGALLTL